MEQLADIGLPRYLISPIYMISLSRSINDISLEAALTGLVISATASRVGRKQINHEQTPARFTEGTLARIDALLIEKEKRSDFIRDAVEREIKRRERQQGSKAAAGQD